MKLKNGQIVLYEIDKSYLNALRKVDHRVSLKQHRRFIGILVSKNNVDYCIPLSTKVYTSNGKKRSKQTTTFIKQNGNPIGVLLYNNMIPVVSSELKIVDINKDPDKLYLINEIRFLYRNQKEIERKSEFVHNKYSKQGYLRKICLNLKALEKEREKWLNKQQVQNITTHNPSSKNIKETKEVLVNKITAFENSSIKNMIKEAKTKIKSLNKNQRAKTHDR